MREMVDHKFLYSSGYEDKLRHLQSDTAKSCLYELSKLIGIQLPDWQPNGAPFVVEQAVNDHGISKIVKYWCQSMVCYGEI